MVAHCVRHSEQSGGHLARDETRVGPLEHERATHGSIQEAQSQSKVLDSAAAAAAAGLGNAAHKLHLLHFKSFAFALPNQCYYSMNCIF